MERTLLKRVMIDQKDMYLADDEIIPRSYPLEDNANYCFVGIRRTGKSYMMYQMIRSLQEQGVPLSQIVYVNFEDERLMELTLQDLNTILEIGLEMAGEGNRPYFFFDEIQNVDGWEKFARRMADMKYRIHLTGSNSRMLSSEMASTLGGRFLLENIFPYSFREFMAAKGKADVDPHHISTREEAEVFGLFESFVSYGAFPELVSIKNKRSYLNNIYQTIYLGDILRRNRITNAFLIRLVLMKIAESVSKPLSYSRLTNIAQSSGAEVGKQTVINYIGYIKDSCLVFTIQNYAAKLLEKETAPKYYFMDTGLLGLLQMDCESAQLENMIGIELVRRYGLENVYFFSHNAEVDFYVPRVDLAVQVSVRVLENYETKRRELDSFVKLRKFLPETKCLLLTYGEEASLVHEGIPVTVLPAWKWLLET